MLDDCSTYCPRKAKTERRRKWGTSWTHDVTLIVLFSGSMLLHPLQSVPIVRRLENVLILSLSLSLSLSLYLSLTLYFSFSLSLSLLLSLSLSFPFSICHSFSRNLRGRWTKRKKKKKEKKRTFHRINRKSAAVFSSARGREKKKACQ